jgi:cobalt-zinc-cadmium efflux system protein
MEKNNPGNHNHDIKRKNLLFTILLNLVITIAETTGGLLSGSLALLSDALHNFSDVIAIILSYFANIVSKKDKTLKQTFGYKRTEILVALLNASVIVVVSLFLFKEAYLRFMNPSQINSMLMLSVAVIGLAANAASVFLLKEDSHNNINVKSAYLHLFSDTLSSVIVILGGIAIYFFRIFWIDHVLTVIIGLYVIKEGYSIIKEAIDILMQSTPEDIDLNKIKEDIERIEHVQNLHHVHVWRLNDKEIHFEGHIDLNENLNLKEIEVIQSQIRKLLFTHFGISHTTIQAETNCCDSKALIDNHI